MFEQFFGRDAEQVESMSQSRQGIGIKIAFANFENSGRRIVGAVVSHAATRRYDFVVLKLFVSFEHCVGVHCHVERQFTHRRHLTSAGPCSGEYLLAAVVCNLPVYGFVCCEFHYLKYL